MSEKALREKLLNLQEKQKNRLLKQKGNEDIYSCKCEDEPTQNTALDAITNDNLNLEIEEVDLKEEDDLNKYLEEIEDLKNDKELTITRMKEKTRENNILIEHNALMETEVKNLRSKNEGLKKKKKGLKKDLEEMTLSKNELETVYANAKKEMHERKLSKDKQIKDLRFELSSKTKQLNETKKSLKEKQDELNSFFEEKQTFETDLEKNSKDLLLSRNRNYAWNRKVKLLESKTEELRDENGRLEKLLNEKDEEMKIIRRKWKEESLLLAGEVGGTATTKIIQLSKKCRVLTAELETEKSKNKTLQSKIETYEDAMDKPYIPEKNEVEKAAMASESELLREKLSQALLRATEQRNETETLKKDLKIAHKVLTQEVGEHGNFHTLLNSTSSWRGRQQQILNLQAKVRQLEEQLSKQSDGVGKQKLLSQGEERHRLHMRKLELEKKEQHEKQEKLLGSVTKERDAYKEKSNAARARNQILVQDVKQLRDQTQAYRNKSEHDDQLVNALLKEQETLKSEIEKMHAEKSTDEDAERVVKSQGDVLFTHQTSEQSIIAKLTSELAYNEDKIKLLEQEIESLKGKQPDGPYVPSPPSSANRRREGSDLRRQLNASSPVENTDETKCLLDAATVEKEKLNQLVHVLQRRNEELVEEKLVVDREASERRNANVSLEKQVEKLKLSQRPQRSNGKSRSPDLNEDMLALDRKLAIEQDNTSALREALDETMKAKYEDLRVYQETIEQTKSIFLQGLRECRKGSASS